MKIKSAKVAKLRLLKDKRKPRNDVIRLTPAQVVAIYEMSICEVRKTKHWVM